jgi:hypothetical protein
MLSASWMTGSGMSSPRAAMTTGSSPAPWRRCIGAIHRLDDARGRPREDRRARSLQPCRIAFRFTSLSSYFVMTQNSSFVTLSNCYPALTYTNLPIFPPTRWPWTDRPASGVGRWTDSTAMKRRREDLSFKRKASSISPS